MSFFVHAIVMFFYYLRRSRIVPHYILFVSKPNLFRKDFEVWIRNIRREDKAMRQCFSI